MEVDLELETEGGVREKNKLSNHEKTQRKLFCYYF